MNAGHASEPHSHATGRLLNELQIDRAARPAPAPPSSRPRRWVVAFVLAGVAMGVGAWGWSRSSAAIPVQVAPVVAHGTSAPGAVLDASGYVVAERTATVSAQITGMVTEVLFDEGDTVEQGQVLARLDARSAAASLEAYQRQAAAAEQLARQYEIQLAQARRDSVRSKELAASHLISRQSAEQASAQAEGLEAQLLSQRRTMEAARAQVQAAQVNLAHTVVRAPFSGVITSKAAQAGEIISPSAASGYTRTGIATIVDMNSLDVEVDVGEAYIGRVRPGMAADVLLNAYPDLRIPAEVAAIIPAADRGKATVKVRVQLKLKDPRVVPDMGARVSFLDTGLGAPVERSRMRVPAAAVSRRMEQDVAFVVAPGGMVQRRVVELGARHGEEREVVAGLSPGENVVLDPPAELDEGTRVAVRGK